MTLRPLALALALALAGCSPAGGPDTAAPATPAVTAEQAAARAAQLQQLYADFWEASLALNPLQATFVGDPVRAPARSPSPPCRTTTTGWRAPASSRS